MDFRDIFSRRNPNPIIQKFTRTLNQYIETINQKLGLKSGTPFSLSALKTANF